MTESTEGSSAHSWVVSNARPIKPPNAALVNLSEDTGWKAGWRLLSVVLKQLSHLGPIQGEHQTGRARLGKGCTPWRGVSLTGTERSFWKHTLDLPFLTQGKQEENATHGSAEKGGDLSRSLS